MPKRLTSLLVSSWWTIFEAVLTLKVVQRNGPLLLMELKTASWNDQAWKTIECDAEHVVPLVDVTRHARDETFAQCGRRRLD